ncbi:prepilin-type N-terminal cleavage/methylation domain-containing protein [Alkalibacterium subtropicum]|uniref:Prepilin-type N-terminal cleavage/methylation domain-containing protein n=1 Tax=Alkalibacterium subtropicum TaxID=753702 RepID=A0A1I1J724_9LACT|nr:prepilin-type N-terminal cleavage/methylation domain-containing protein [Alkalibacterium subtropicum]SFC41220.1 prepilin-type N-terminal cleavage/methylation domain-containing protein [Alkalibacterium subtropicum]
MQKWRHACLLKKRLTNSVNWKSDKGITLVELLASLAILSVVILLAGSVHLFGQRQFISQTESASQANNMSYALSVMSRDLRKEEGETVTVSDGGTKITTGTGLIFAYNGSEILKNGSTLIDSVSSMTVKKNSEDSIEIKIESQSPQSQTRTYKTTIYFRR